MAHHGQHATCPKCGTDQPFTISGNLAGHPDPARLPDPFRSTCAGSGMTSHQITRAAKENRS